MTLEEFISQMLEDSQQDSLVNFAEDIASGVSEALDKPNYPNFSGGPVGDTPTVKSLLGSIGEMAAEMSPGLGDLLSAKDAVEEAQDGNYGWSALSAMGALPIIPQLGIFAGKTAKTANLAKLAEAERLVAEGADATKPVGNTGWFKAPWDNQWRFEISDSGLKVNPGEGAAKEIFEHPTLYENYPEIAQYKTNATERQWFGGGEFNSKTKTLKAEGAGEGLRGTAAHELQHAVQEIEGFGRGGSQLGISFDLINQKADAAIALYEVERAYQAALKNPGSADLLNLFTERTRLKHKVDALTKYNKLPFAKRDAGTFKAYQSLPGEVESRLVTKRLSNPSPNPLDDLDTPIEKILSGTKNDYSDLLRSILKIS